MSRLPERRLVVELSVIVIAVVVVVVVSFNVELVVVGLVLVAVVVVKLVSTHSRKARDRKIWSTVDFVDLSTSLSESIRSVAQLLQEVGETCQIGILLKYAIVIGGSTNLTFGQGFKSRKSFICQRYKGLMSNQKKNNLGRITRKPCKS